MSQEPQVPVVVEVRIKMVLDVSQSWTNDPDRDLKDYVEFWLNESSHCAGNELGKLAERLDARGLGCSCNQTETEFVRVATPDDKTRFHYEGERDELPATEPLVFK